MFGDDSFYCNIWPCAECTVVSSSLSKSPRIRLVVRDIEEENVAEVASTPQEEPAVVAVEVDEVLDTADLLVNACTEKADMVNTVKV